MIKIKIAFGSEGQQITERKFFSELENSAYLQGIQDMEGYTKQDLQEIDKGEKPDVWDFVERYYPKYTSSDDIAENDALRKILDDEIDEGSRAQELWQESGENKDTIQILYDSSYSDILERSILAFIESK